MIYLKEMAKEVRDEDTDGAANSREWESYRKHLASLKPRLSKNAWKYFWEGFAETGIHDARLVALTIGDGLRRVPERSRLKIKADFINQSSKYLFSFSYSRIKRFDFQFDATVGQHLIDRATGKDFHSANAYLDRNELGDVMGDELTAVDDRYLRHEILFVSQARIVIEAAQLSFGRNVIKQAKRRSRAVR
ncbi:MAG TPA: hypothetical protein VEW69_09405 [Alphaproteobacteria bacterium]|nr:hypothetical protein [Alphaproteobacteria bacterium]